MHGVWVWQFEYRHTLIHEYADNILQEEQINTYLKVTIQYYKLDGQSAFDSSVQLVERWTVVGNSLLSIGHRWFESGSKDGLFFFTWLETLKQTNTPTNTQTHRQINKHSNVEYQLSFSDCLTQSLNESLWYST